MSRSRRLVSVAKIPVACLLADGERQDRLSAWAMLIETTSRELTPTERGVRARFASAAEPDLKRLVAGEQVCCSWAEWTVSPAVNEIVLTVTAFDELGTETLQQLFGL